MQLQLDTSLVLLILSFLSLSTTATYNYYRLPTSIEPDRYKIKIITHLDNFTFEGDVSIHFKVLETTSNITLHARNLTIDETKINLRSSSDENFEYCANGTETVPKYNYYIIQLCEPLHKDAVYTVKLDFSGILNDNLNGYYRSSYVTKESKEKRWLTVTKFEPIHARAAFPCLDEPNYKAKFTIWLGHDKSLTALSNMPLERQKPLNDTENFIWSIFEESIPMSTYLVAYTINDFAYKTSPKVKGSNVTFRTWYQKELIDQCDYAAEIGPTVLMYFEDLLGITLPFSKVDAIAIPDLSAGAMENWGLITYSEGLLLFDPNEQLQEYKPKIVMAIAHELAHQWFGNLVTIKWWSDIWLNEGFATYIGSLGAQNFSSEFNSYIEEHIANMLDILSDDMLNNTHPITEPILNSDAIKSHFDAISYQKGDIVLRMLHMFMGHDGFFTAIRSYLKKHAYQNTVQDDLWAEFTESARKYKLIKPEYSIKTIMDSWTLQSGYPLVKVTRDYSSGKVYITQQRYMQTDEISEEETQKCWWVPLTYTTASEIDFVTTLPRAWLECDESGKRINLTLDYVTSGDEWILFNLQFSGVYRVQYDMENWRLIKNVLNSPEYTNIHVLNRVELIVDVTSLAWTGRLDYNLVFDILDYLIQEHEILPWSTAIKCITNVQNFLDLSQEHSKYFKAYMRHIIAPIYNQVTDNSENTQDVLTHKSEIFIMSCDCELKECLTDARNFFEQWKFSVDPNAVNFSAEEIKSTAFCLAVRHGNSDDWQFIWQRYQQSNVSSEREIMLYSLSCSRNATVLNNLLHMAFSEPTILSGSESITVLSAIVQQSYELAWTYLAENMNKVMSSDNLCDVLYYLADEILPHDVESFKKFIEIRKEFWQKCTYQSLFKYIDKKMKWFEKKADKIKGILKERLFLQNIPVNENE